MRHHIGLLLVGAKRLAGAHPGSNIRRLYDREIRYRFVDTYPRRIFKGVGWGRELKYSNTSTLHRTLPYYHGTEEDFPALFTKHSRTQTDHMPPTDRIALHFFYCASTYTLLVVLLKLQICL